MWVTIKMWENLADNVANSFPKGSKTMRVTVSGRLTEEKWTDQNNNEKTQMTITADNVSVCLDWQTVGAIQYRGETAKGDYSYSNKTEMAASILNAEEVKPRPMSEVPHPFIEETVALFAKANRATKSKIIFIHFNHSNPLLDEQHPNRLALEKEGFRFAREGDVYGL